MKFRFQDDYVYANKLAKRNAHFVRNMNHVNEVSEVETKMHLFAEITMQLEMYRFQLLGFSGKNGSLNNDHHFLLFFCHCRSKWALRSSDN